jgi:hypothetical protein
MQSGTARLEEAVTAYHPALEAYTFREFAAQLFTLSTAGGARGSPPLRRDTPLATMLKTPVFWRLFVMMTMMSTGGLMVISQFAPLHAKLWHRRRDDHRHGGAALRGIAGSRHQRSEAAVLRLGRDFLTVSSTLTDTFGTRDATTKYGFLYMARVSGWYWSIRLPPRSKTRLEAGFRC